MRDLDLHCRKCRWPKRICCEFRNGLPTAPLLLARCLRLCEQTKNKFLVSDTSIFFQSDVPGESRSHSVVPDTQTIL